MPPEEESRLAEALEKEILNAKKQCEQYEYELTRLRTGEAAPVKSQ